MPHEFDNFFEENGYKDGEQSQAYADFLASKTGSKVTGRQMDTGKTVASDPRFDKPEELI